MGMCDGRASGPVPAVRSLAGAGVFALIAASVLTGCSGSDRPATVGPNGSGTSAPAGSSSAPASGPRPGTPADPATRQAITSAYHDFFDSTSTTARSEAALQHGAAFHRALVEQGRSSYSEHSGVQVGAIGVRGAVADVTFTITSDGTPLLSNVRGFAVREDGRWKVAATTVCTLLKLEGNPPSACSDPSITALPTR